jgi:hypothetical protein
VSDLTPFTIQGEKDRTEKPTPTKVRTEIFSRGYLASVARNASTNAITPNGTRLAAANAKRVAVW